MQLAKAIEILTDWGVISKPQVDQDLLDAVKLGIEALKRGRNNRKYPELTPYPLLPGETLEVYDVHS